MLSKNLATLRKLNGYSQEKIADRLQVSRQAVAKWESGETAPDIHNCIALAKLYGVSLDDLVSYEETKEGLPIPPKGKHVFGTVVLGERGQIVIPKRAREIFHFQPGDSLIILGDEDSGGIAIVNNDVFMKTIEAVIGKIKDKPDIKKKND